jgi:P4 family phage/plasmid primase-like protien
VFFNLTGDFIMAFSYSRGKTKFDNAPKQIVVNDFNEFVDAVANDISASKGLTYVCAALSSGIHYVEPEKYQGINHWRLAKYGQARQFLAFDFDGFDSPKTFAEAITYLEEFNCIVYTTASHTNEKPRARAIIELSRAVTSDEGKALGDAAQKEMEEIIGAEKIKFDESVYRAIQPIYTPILDSKITRYQGVALDVDKLLTKHVSRKANSQELAANAVFINTASLETNENVDCMLSALSAIPAKIDRQTWCNIIFSVKAHQFQCSEQAARDWSRSAGDYHQVINPQGYDQRAFDDVWKYNPQSIGAGKLYHYAKQYGWAGHQGELFPKEIEGMTVDSFGDIFNGKKFAKFFSGKMLFCYPRSKWLKFTGLRWEWCMAGEELQAAKQVAQQIAQLAANEFAKNPTDPNSKKLLQHAQNTQNAYRLEAMLEMAAAEPSMGIGDISQFDSDPMLLGCRNGVIELDYGHLLHPMPHMLITRQVAANFDHDAKCSSWLAFLNQCFLGNQETINYIQKALGYTLTGAVSEEVLHFCFGMGRNGKSVFANVIAHIMGDYGITAPAEMLMRKEKNGASNDIARLCGARLVLANETRSDQRFDDLTIKTLVSTERIAARFLYSELFEFWPTFKIWVRGNHKPVITDDSNGAWRRIRLVPFENNVSEDLVDPDLEAKLLAEKDGILMWMVEGVLKWKSEGLNPSNQIRAASNQYRDDCDIIGEFIGEGYSLDPSLKISQNELWTSWQFWAKQNGYHQCSKKTFTRRLKDRGITTDSYIGGQRAYAGIGRTTPST